MLTRHHAPVNLGGRPAVGLFIISLIAFVAETQLSQYVQSNLGFRHPYLIFYMVHSTFAIMFPLHLLYLAATTQHSLSSICKSVIDATQRHLSPKSAPDAFAIPAFPTKQFVRLLCLLTVGMSAPALLWFIAVVMAPVTDVTALWNTNAFFAYVFATLATGAKWEVRRLSAVVIATAGAAAVVYGGCTIRSDKSDLSTDHSHRLSNQETPRSPLLGDLLTLTASIIYGAYQVLYKIYAALPSDPEVQTDDFYSVLATSPDDPSDGVEDPSDDSLAVGDDVVHPLPFGLHPNMLTSAIGICTMLVLWIPIPFLHILGVDAFQLPHNAITYCVIAGIALSGTVFNAGFMVLLGVWGPIVTSVGSLLTIVLVFVSDAVFGGAVQSITIWSMLGCGSIVVAFAILAHDMMKGR